MNSLLAPFLLLAPQDPARAPGKESAFETAVRARATDLSGDAGDGLEYSDFFRTGYGVSLQVSWMADPDRSTFGLWASLGFDRFGGDGFSDDLGDRVSADPLDRYLALAGGRVRLLFEEPVFRGDFLFLDIRLGAGLAGYGDVDAVFRTGGTTTKGVDLFDSGIEAAGEAAISTGVTSRMFHFGFGVAFRWIGGPDRGSDVSGIVDPGTWTDVSFEVGMEYRF